MAAETTIGYSPISEKVYLGKANPKSRTWVGAKKDITNDFLAVAHEYFEEGTIRDISCSDGTTNLFINVRKDPKSIEKAIKALSKLIEPQFP